MAVPSLTTDPSVYAKIVWTGLISDLDGLDADDLPDKAELVGNILFTPTTNVIKFPTGVPRFTLALTRRKVSLANSQIDEQGRKYIMLEASSASSVPQTFGWRCTFDLQYKSQPVAIPEVTITPLAGTTIDLTDYLPVAGNTVPVTPDPGLTVGWVETSPGSGMYKMGLS